MSYDIIPAINCGVFLNAVIISLLFWKNMTNEFGDRPITDQLTHWGDLKARELRYCPGNGVPPIDVVYVRETTGNKVLAFPPEILSPQNVLTTYDGKRAVTTLNLSDALAPEVMKVEHTRNVSMSVVTRKEASGTFRLFPQLGIVAMPEEDLLSFTIYERDNIKPDQVTSCRAGVLYSKQYASKNGVYYPARNLWPDVDETLWACILSGLKGLSPANIKLRILEILGNVRIITSVRMVNVEPAPAMSSGLEQNSIDIVTENTRICLPCVRVSLDIGSRPINNFITGEKTVLLREFDHVRRHSPFQELAA
jgi:hypothetical protein